MSKCRRYKKRKIKVLIFNGNFFNFATAYNINRCVDGNFDKQPNNFRILKKSLSFLLLFTVVIVHHCVAQFDTTTINKFSVYFFLASENSTKKDMALKYIADSTSSIEPHILMMAGMILYAKGYKDSSMYWIYLGDIRARYLASLYTERSDAALYSSFHAIAIQLTQDYAKNNVQTLYTKINQALDYDSLNPLRPLEFLERSTDTSKYIPMEEWKQHYTNVRQAYYHLEQEILQNGNAIFEDKRGKQK